MAGIGFVLRKLTEKDTFTSTTRAYMHAVLASAGPWLVTVLALTAIFYFTRNVVEHHSVLVFRTVVMYNFCLSIVLTAPIAVVATRFLSDCIYQRDLQDAPGMLLGILIITYAVVVPVGVGFYFFVATVSKPDALAAVVHLTLISSVWVASIYVSALKFYSGITYSFLFGMLCSVGITIGLGDTYGATGMILGFGSGFAIILAAILALVFAEYPKTCKNLFKVLEYFPRYWDLALGAFFLAVAMWVDKWIMWFAPQAEMTVLGLPRYPAYDSAMFFAYLTIFPSMAAFLLSQETLFFEAYLRFYNAVAGHKPFRKLVEQHSNLVSTLWDIVRALMVLQLFIGGVVAFVAPKLFQMFGISLVGVGMFRFGVMGVAFQILATFLGVFIAYFDHRPGVLLVNTFFLVANVSLSVATLYFGFSSYGYGFFLASLLTFAVASVVLERYVRNLPYHTFISNNTALGKGLKR